MNTLSGNDEAFSVLESRIKTILPEKYQDCYEDIEPLPMGSAGLKYSAGGKVAWNEIWATFCDLAMAGGPPHKGRLLVPASLAEIQAGPDRYGCVVKEICRGVTMVTGLACGPSATPGWIRVQCAGEAMAGWLVRAILMENISAHCERAVLSLPAAPDYRLEKEIKNVITGVAKTCHYWNGHVPPAQQAAIGRLFAKLDMESPLIQPPLARHDCDAERFRLLSLKIAEAIYSVTGLGTSHGQYQDWIGVACPSIHAAIWMMRAIAASNMVARREGNTLFIPVDPASDPDGQTAAQAVRQAHRFTVARGIL
ncbi:MAG TPA: hypothetical protein VMF91_23045 [Bryobacteraceae bacterium]|nr:hypothetical protein [Bryobacteraceae bacterium]